jgi:hypothetical protein
VSGGGIGGMRLYLRVSWRQAAIYGGVGLCGKAEIKKISVKLLDMGSDKMGMFPPFCGFPPFPIGTRSCQPDASFLFPLLFFLCRRWVYHLVDKLR